MTSDDLDSVWNFADPAGTETQFRLLLDRPDCVDDVRLELQTQIVRAIGLQGRFDEAHRLLGLLERSLTDASPMPIWAMRFYLERGRVYNSSGQRDRARAEFLRVWEANANPMDDDIRRKRYLVDAIHMLAIVGASPAEQIEWGERGIAIALAEPPVLRWIPPLCNNLGETYRGLKQYEKALACFEMMIATYPRLGRPIDRYARVDEAKMLRLLGRLDESSKKIRALADELAKANEMDGFVCEEYAETLLAEGRDDEAKAVFRTAWQQLRGEDWLRDAEPLRYERLRTLGT